MLVSAWRHLQVDAPIPLQGRAHMWVFGTLCAAHIAGHWVAPAGYLSAMEVSSALLRLTALSDGAWLLQR